MSEHERWAVEIVFRGRGVPAGDPEDAITLLRAQILAYLDGQAVPGLRIHRTVALREEDDGPPPSDVAPDTSPTGPRPPRRPAGLPRPLKAVP